MCVNSLLVVLEHERCSQINLSPNNLTLLKDKLPGSVKVSAMLTSTRETCEYYTVRTRYTLITTPLELQNIMSFTRCGKERNTAGRV